MNKMTLQQYDDCSVPNLNIGRHIDTLKSEERQEYLQLVSHKLGFGGVLEIRGLHLPSFCKSFLFSQCDPSVILGLQSVTDLQELLQNLQRLGLKIVEQSIDNNIYTVKATK